MTNCTRCRESTSATLASYSPLGGSNSTSSLSTVQGYATERERKPVSAQNDFCRPGLPARRWECHCCSAEKLACRTPRARQRLRWSTKRSFVIFSRIRIQSAIDFGFDDDKPSPSSGYEIVGVLKDAQFDTASTKKIQETMFLALLQDQSQFALSAEVEARTCQAITVRGNGHSRGN